METVTRRVAKPKQKSELAAGRRKGPKRDPEQRTGYEAEGTHMRRSHDQDSGDVHST